jgi:selenocysteine lyase/cysteine desulfurase
MSSDPEVAATRSCFRVFKKKIYLNSCSQGALCDAVEASQQEHIQSWHETGSPWDLWVEKYEAARMAFARFIGAEADEVAIVPCASAGINSIASALDFRSRRKVVMGEFEFPTMGQIWLAQQRRGMEIQFLESHEDRLSVDAYAKAIDNQTLIVPLTHVCFMNGFRSDVRVITRLAHERGALVMLDDYQDAGTRPVNVKELNIDFYVTGALKYLLCPSGIAFLYVRRDLIEGLTPTITGWFGQQNPFAFDTKHFDPAHSAKRFEMGSPPVPHVYAVSAALDFLHSVGLERIAEHVSGLTRKLQEGARQLQIQVKTPPDSRGPLVVLRMKDAEAMVRKLAEHDIIASNRIDGLRLSFHVYNSVEDVQATLSILEQYRHLTLREPAFA